MNAPRVGGVIGGSSTLPLRARGGLVRRAPRGGGSLGQGAARDRSVPRGLIAFVVSRFWAVAIMAVLGCHLAFGTEAYPLFSRVLLAVPAVLFMVELRSYLVSEKGELPFLVFAMLQYYMAFGFPVFLDVPFFDLTGPVTFSPATHILASVAVALGALCIAGSARLGMRLGGGLQRFSFKVLPPETAFSRWDDAFFLFAGVSVAIAAVLAFSPYALPAQLNFVVLIVFQIEFVTGLAAVRPPRALGRWASLGLLAVVVSVGMLRGQLDPIARQGMAFVTARWVTVRKISLAFMVAMAGLFLILQPAKSTYREQVWGRMVRTGEQVGLSDRVDAWESAFEHYFSDEPRRRSEESGSAAARLSEIDPVMHALDVVPFRIDYLYGAGFAQILYAPIPRLIWAGKPSSGEEVAQRYAVIFGRQTERGAETTAIGLNLLVEGYWNFGWFGIVLVCTAVGLTVGAMQTLFSGAHWALRAIGVAQISVLSVGNTAVVLFSSLFQFMAGRLIAVWGVFWLAQLLSERVRQAPRVLAGRLARR
jgi:hypothetical protein